MRVKDSDNALKVRQATLSTLELTGLGCFGRLVGIGDGLAGRGCAAGGGLRLACRG